MEYQAWFQCIGECGERHGLDEVVYKCNNCGGLLEVRHDVKILKQQKPYYWMKLFDDRYLRTEWPYGSGSGGKRR